MRLTLILFFFTIATQAEANVLHFQNLPKGWTAHQIKPGSPEAKAVPGASAILNYHETPKGTEATIQVMEFPMPDEKLGSDTAAWRRLMFSKPATAKPNIISERAINVNGQWRYLLHFETDPTVKGVETLAMGTAVNGKLQVFLIEQDSRLIKKIHKAVFEMYKTVAVRSTSQ